eukprot:TRINITY_DN10200_c0_g5_i1.p1 TRINITY_DN10200_c0_g5~~TRINITY_DN10200_c0_g5_i1.p1  ORF type:complete len:507 (+),score=75.17 TRINITY_DN10200_c0_g5_i1:83-1522(+)
MSQKLLQHGHQVHETEVARPLPKNQSSSSIQRGNRSPSLHRIHRSPSITHEGLNRTSSFKRTMSGSNLKRRDSFNLANSFRGDGSFGPSGRSPSMIANEPEPEELFPKDPPMAELERRDREWLEYRRSERLKQEQEDLLAYTTRTTERKKMYYLAQNPPEIMNGGEPPSLEERVKQSEFRIMVCIDKKKAKEHAIGLIHSTYQNSHQDNKIYLYNCFTKKSSKRQTETIAHLEQIKKQLLRHRSGMDVTVSCSHVRDKQTAITDFSVSKSINLIILGMKKVDKSFFARKISPGILESCPDNKAILLVPPPGTKKELSNTELDKGRQILLCFDGSPHCESALLYLARLLKCNDTVVIINIVTPPPKLLVVQQADDHASLQPNQHYESILSARLDSAEQLLNRVKIQLQKISQASIDIDVRILEAGKRSVGDVLLEVATQLSSDMIVLGSRGVDGWQKVVQGAVMKPILETATRRSVLVVR